MPTYTACAILTTVMSSNSISACIVIPIYQTTLSGTEQLSLRQCLAILGSHPIFIAKPVSLDLQQLIARHPQLHCESFPDDYFKGIDGYNRLMLSDEFYQRFSAYEYLLIYQLDAFVFSDQLLRWCQRGYDYVGAPWIPRNSPQPPSLRTRIKQKVYQWLNKKNADHSGAHHAQYDYLGGNGGFSLRRIPAMRRTLQQLKHRLPPYLQRRHHTRNEDIFFCVEANRFRTHVRIAPFPEALQFSWESHPAAAAALNHGKLPFGCHGWDKLHRDQWRPIFKALGHDLDHMM